MRKDLRAVVGIVPELQAWEYRCEFVRIPVLIAADHPIPPLETLTYQDGERTYCIVRGRDGLYTGDIVESVQERAKAWLPKRIVVAYVRGKSLAAVFHAMRAKEMEYVNA